MFFKVSMMFFCLAYSYVDIDVRLKQNGIYDPPRRQISNEILKKEDDGLWRSRYENGVVKSEGKFIRKWRFLHFKRVYYKEGVWKYYSNEENLIKEKFYKMGELINIKIETPINYEH